MRCGVLQLMLLVVWECQREVDRREQREDQSLHDAEDEQQRVHHSLQRNAKWQFEECHHDDAHPHENGDQLVFTGDVAEQTQRERQRPRQLAHELDRKHQGRQRPPDHALGLAREVIQIAQRTKVFEREELRHHEHAEAQRQRHVQRVHQHPVGRGIEADPAGG